MTPRPEQIVTAWAEPVAGPGWSNRPVLYVWRDGDGKYHLEYIQPKEQTAEMASLYRVSHAVHDAMVAAVRKAVRP